MTDWFVDERPTLCPICDLPASDEVREDQVWGNCPTNAPHEPHPRSVPDAPTAAEGDA